MEIIKRLKRINKTLLRRATSLLLFMCLLIGISYPNFGLVIPAPATAASEGSNPISVAITKTVQGKLIKEWWSDTHGSDDGLSEFANGMSYEIFAVKYDFSREAFFIVENELDDLYFYDTGSLIASISKIEFDVPEAGWYAIYERLSGSAAKTFTATDPLIVYVGPNGVIGAVEKSNANGTFTTQHMGGYSRGLKLIYTASEIPKTVYPPSIYPERYTDDGQFFVSGTKPDGSGQAFTAEKFVVTMPDGSKGLSFCADLGAHFIYGDYVFDSTNHNFTNEQLYFIIAAFDYLHDLLRLTTDPNDPIRHDDLIEGKALAQILLWNMILEVDKVDRNGERTKNAGYADLWWQYLGFPSYVEVDRIEGTADWYNRDFLDWHNGGKHIEDNFPELIDMTYSDLINDMLNDLRNNKGIKYIDRYNDKLDKGKDPGVGGVVFVTGAANSGHAPIDQQRQLFVLFGGGSLSLDSSLYYDVALRKWVSAVGRDGLVDNIYSKSGVNTDVPSVKVGDKVTFKIEVYNQTDNATWVSNLVDYIPAGYEYKASDNGNLWGSGDAIGPETLKYYGPAFRLEDSNAAKTLSIVLTVQAGADGTVLRNAAEVLEIRKDADEPGDPGDVVPDIDSTFTDDERRNWDPRREKDNVISENGKTGGDKDDYDFAEVIISNTLDISVTKIWEDNSNAFGMRPASITIHLKKDGVTIETRTLTGTGNSWSLIFRNLPVEGVYTVTEDTVPGYSSVTDGSNVSAGFTITNTVIKPVTEVTVDKVWVDGDNFDATRPVSITINLLRNGTKVADKTMSTPLWAPVTFTDLLIFDDNGDEYIYTVTEDHIADYSCVVTGTASGGYTITNTLTTKITVTKTWEDEYNSIDNYFGVRPASVTINLLRNGGVINSMSISAATTWQGVFTTDQWGVALPKYDPDGNLYTYTVAEVSINSYETEIDAVTGGFKITNSLVYDAYLVKIVVKKEWHDGGFVDKRPDAVTVELWKDGAPTGSTISLEAEDWTGYFEVEKGPFYMVKEVGGDWVTSYDYDIVYASAEEHVMTATITNTWIPPVTSVSVSKVWVDDGNADRTRPTNIEVFLLRETDGSSEAPAVFRRHTIPGADNIWSHTFVDLPMYDTSDPHDYKLYVYTIEEAAVAGYDVDVAGTASDGFTITNTLEPDKVTVSGRKSWNLGGWSGGTAPTQADIDASAIVGVTLFRRIPGQTPTEVNTLLVTTATSLTPWTYTYNSDSSGGILPKYDELGRRYEYFVTETSLTGVGSASFAASAAGMDITNTLDVSGVTTQVTATKIWVDNGNAYGTRPSSITFILYQNGVEFKRQSLSGTGNTWSFTFTGLPEYNAVTFRANVYTVDEVVTAGYFKDLGADGLTVTNTLAPGITSVSVEKAWVDGIDLNMRPETLDVLLQRSADGGVSWTDVATVTLSRYGWNFTWSNLPKFSGDQKMYQYRVKEDLASAMWVEPTTGTLTSLSPGGHGLTEYYVSPAITERSQNNFVITNIRKGTNVSGRKIWDDNNNADNTRPTIITVELLRNGAPLPDPVILRVGGPRWEWTFSGLAEGYTYSVREANVPEGYTATYSSPGGSAAMIELNITNKYVPKIPVVPIQEIETDDPPLVPSPPPPDPQRPLDDTDDDTDDFDDIDDTDDTDDSDEQDQIYIPGGFDREIPPNPTALGNMLVAGDDGIFFEFGDDGVPLGMWRWDDFEELWIFEEYPPLAFLPMTGYAGVLSYLFVMLGLSLLGMWVSLRIVAKMRGKLSL